MCSFCDKDKKNKDTLDLSILHVTATLLRQELRTTHIILEQKKKQIWAKVEISASKKALSKSRFVK